MAPKQALARTGRMAKPRQVFVLSMDPLEGLLQPLGGYLRIQWEEQGRPGRWCRVLWDRTRRSQQAVHLECQEQVAV